MPTTTRRAICATPGCRKRVAKYGDPTDLCDDHRPFFMVELTDSHGGTRTFGRQYTGLEIACAVASEVLEQPHTVPSMRQDVVKVAVFEMRPDPPDFAEGTRIRKVFGRTA